MVFLKMIPCCDKTDNNFKRMFLIISLKHISNLSFRIMEGGESKSNPWQVNQLEEFLFFCCPGCDNKSQAKETFLEHAMTQHPESLQYLAQFQFSELEDKLPLPDDPIEEDFKFKVKEEFFDEDFLDVEINEGLQIKQDVQCYKCAQIMDPEEIESHLRFAHDVTVKEDFGPIRNYQCEWCHRALKSKKSAHKCIGKRKAKALKVKPPKGKIKCKLCDKEYETESGYSKHKKTHENKVWPCDKCDFVTNTKRNLNCHIHNKHTEEGREKKHFCTHCAKGFQSKTFCEKHESTCLEKEENKEKTFSCDECMTVLKGEIAYKNHLRLIHKIQGGSVTCEFCGRLFGNEHNYKIHRKSVHPTQSEIDKVKCFCDKCSTSFTNANELNKHLKDCLDEAARKNIICALCNQDGWYSMTAVKKHSAEEHRKYLSTCVKCQLTFTSDGTLKVHKQNVHLTPKYQCAECGEAFLKQRNLDKHKFRIHNDRSVTHYKCPHCDFESVIRENLKEHINVVHTQEKLYHCPHCDFTNLRQKVLKSHIASIHEKRRNNKCTKCPAAYYNRRELDKHKLSHGH